MKHRIVSFWLFLFFLHAVHSHAQDFPVTYKTSEDLKKSSLIDSINYTLNHIHLVRNANLDSSLKILYSLYNKSVMIGYYEGIGAASAEIGASYLNKGDFKKAEKYILYSQLLPPLSEYFSTNAVNNLYLIYESRGDYNLALRYLKRAMASKDKNVANIAYNNYIALLLKLGRFKESLYYIDILKTKARTSQQYRVLAALLCNEATVYSSMKDYPKFDSISDECLQLCARYNFDDIATYSYINSATSYYERGKADKAISLFTRIKDRIPKLPPDYQMGYYSEYGKVLYNTGSYRAAIDNINQGMQIAKQIGIRTNIEPIHDLARSYQALGDYTNANRQFENYIRLKDSFQNIEIQKNINEYEIKFRTAEKDNELLNKKLTILNQSNKISNKNTIILLSAIGLLLLLILFFAYHKYARQNLLMLERDLDLAEQKSRVNFLKATMQGEEKERKRIGVALHNGVGSQLTAINLNLTAFQWKNKHIPEAERLNEIITQIQQTAIEVRKTAHNLLPAAILEQGLYQAIKEFTSQFKNSPVKIGISKSGNIDIIGPSLALLVYRILQELISNAVKHAEATEIDIDLQLTGHILSASITDNGKGFDLSSNDGKGLGIQQIQEQLELLKGTFDIHTQPGKGTTIYFGLDLRYSKDDQL